MPEQNNTDIGTIKISTDVIFSYVFSAVLGTEGVTSFSGIGFSDAIQKNILGRENKYKGVKIDSTDEGYAIDVYIFIRYGERIPDIAWNVQKNVKHNLEEVMQIDIASVNIHVQGVKKDGEDGDGDGAAEADAAAAVVAGGRAEAKVESNSEPDTEDAAK
ncbi:MAG: Asp23/Gls24 family envelope stress response protein [Clostridiales Family XIII bacterium]|jgi:uncharacterized alkaline shock family protein YloU|nr:Asp23/Gls24 family envelope stress response protein [Clostridiales Family XIII bacterium]